MSKSKMPDLAIDACTLVNFAEIDRLDVFASYPSPILVTDIVRCELRKKYRHETGSEDGADEVIGRCQGNVVALTEMPELIAYMSLQHNKLHAGERTIFALSEIRRCAAVTDDFVAIKEYSKRVERHPRPGAIVWGSKDLLGALVKAALLKPHVAADIEARLTSNGVKLKRP